VGGEAVIRLPVTTSTRRRAQIAAALTAALAGISCQAPARANASVTISYRDAFTTELPGSPSGRSFADQFTNSADPNAKPSALSHFHLQLPAGARFDTTAIPRCEASDLELMLIGADACPPRSKVGSETFVFDTGLSGPGRFDTSDVTFFNELNGVILLSQDRQTGLRLVTHGKIGADSEDIALPTLPGTLPDGGADRQETAQYPVATGDHNGRPAAYLTTPASCPPTGQWLLQATYTFHDGTQQTLVSSSPCKRAEPASGLSIRQPAKAKHRHIHRRPKRRAARHAHRDRRPRGTVANIR
jgi:hypothetical protein